MTEGCGDNESRWVRELLDADNKEDGEIQQKEQVNHTSILKKEETIIHPTCPATTDEGPL